MPDRPSSAGDPAEPRGVTNVSGGIPATNSILSAGADIVGCDKITHWVGIIGRECDDQPQSLVG